MKKSPLLRYGVVVHDNVIFGENVIINDNAIVGRQPSLISSEWQKVEATPLPLVVGDNVTIGSGAIVYAGCYLDNSCFIADLACIREGVFVGEGAVVGRGATVEMKAIILEGVTISTGAHIGGGILIGKEAFIGPNACLVNGGTEGVEKKRKGEDLSEYKATPSVIMQRAYLGANCTILSGKNIGEGAIVGAGAVVTKDIPAGEVWAGNPARKIR